MANQRKERVLVTENGDYARQERVVEYERSIQSIIVSRINQLITLTIIVINLLLMTRIMLQLIRANSSNVFVNFIYSSTEIFVAPFQTIVANPTLANGSTIDVGSIIAVVVYALFGWILTTLIRILFSDSGGTRLETRYEKRS